MLNHVPRKLAIIALLSQACSRPFNVSTPNGFVELENQDSHGYAYRAAHPDGLVAAVRVIENKPPGDLAFWSRAVENQLRQAKGYRLLQQAPVRNRDGIPGNLLQFGHDEGTTPHLYRVALFTHGERLYLLEVGGTKELVTAHEPTLAEFVNSFAMK